MLPTSQGHCEKEDSERVGRSRLPSREGQCPRPSSPAPGLSTPEGRGLGRWSPTEAARRDKGPQALRGGPQLRRFRFQGTSLAADSHLPQQHQKALNPMSRAERARFPSAPIHLQFQELMQQSWHWAQEEKEANWKGRAQWPEHRTWHPLTDARRFSLWNNQDAEYRDEGLTLPPLQSVAHSSFAEKAKTWVQQAAETAPGCLRLIGLSSKHKTASSDSGDRAEELARFPHGEEKEDRGRRHSYLPGSFLREKCAANPISASFRRKCGPVFA
ncbi:hypothetical protein H920_19662 [Fukomys damarensis]|uniref:Uncharacterized protein n=1 Tax=Fukomys damarensis TaxID=885580 RepID=A0A091CN59_FUKDA|nr:hypothetical protein H920_19662 [Fukomys damarensis]